MCIVQKKLIMRQTARKRRKMEMCEDRTSPFLKIAKHTTKRSSGPFLVIQKIKKIVAIQKKLW